MTGEAGMRQPSWRKSQLKGLKGEQEGSGRAKEEEFHPGFCWGLLLSEVTWCLQKPPARWGACVCAVELGIRKWNRLILR